MNILVTGGAGYIGAELVFNLSKLPEVKRIVVYDNLSRGNCNLFISSSNKITSGNVEFVMGDLLDTRKLKKALKDIDVVFHLAAQVTSPYQNLDSHFFEQTNNWGTAELTYAIEETPSVKKLIYLSSTGVYGASKKSEELNEDAKLNPRAHYAISKMRGEDHIARFFGKIDTYILRAGNVFGYSPTIRFDTVINKFLFEANFNNRIQIHGSGKQVRPFVNLSNLLKSLMGCANGSVPSGIYNVVDRNHQVLDLVDVLKEIYPSLEFIFINQHLDLRGLNVEPSSKIKEFVKFNEITDFKQELLDVKNRSFAF